MRAVSHLGLRRTHAAPQTCVPTRYMDAAVKQLRADGFDVRDEDVARLSPFVRHHINLLGRYSFQLPARRPASAARPGRHRRRMTGSWPAPPDVWHPAPLSDWLISTEKGGCEST
ncbi:Tn3 family transposase [Nocardia sp. 2TAF39]|uniref:Tn3 family transposase n=1 Tax=unclassified Nocardia TaxID=2637762 RepID=UPI003F999642